jgi:hypothetical protein
MPQPVEIVPLTSLELPDIIYAARDLNNMATHPDVVEHLDSRHLHGVIDRHGVSIERSAATLRSAQTQMEKGGLQAYLLRDSQRVIGQATLIPDIALRRQRTPLPPAIDSLIPLFGGKSEDMSELGANVAAWANNREYDRIDYLNILAQAYTHLREQTAMPVWTIEPAHSSVAGLHAVFDRARYDPHDPGYYDDQESRRHSVRLSYLYTANAAA